MSIPVFRPTLRRRDFNSVLGCLVSDRIGCGPLNHELAGELARFLGVAGGACLVSFTQAVHCALEALELSPGDAVVLSALAPADYLPALAGRGLRALVAEVDPASGLILRSEVERHLAAGPEGPGAALSPRLRAGVRGAVLPRPAGAGGHFPGAGRQPLPAGSQADGRPPEQSSAAAAAWEP